MIVTYCSGKLQKTFSSDKEMIKAYGTRAKKLKQRHNELKASENLEAIGKIPAARLHPLKGNKGGEWAVDIFKNWRICFTLNHNPIPKLEDGSVDLAKVNQVTIVSIEDYH